MKSLTWPVQTFHRIDISCTPLVISKSVHSMRKEGGAREAHNDGISPVPGGYIPPGGVLAEAGELDAVDGLA